MAGVLAFALAELQTACEVPIQRMDVVAHLRVNPHHTLYLAGVVANVAWEKELSEQVTERARA
eukprot:2074483-Pyramimonas_sp.AAC.2